jgi:amidophosphoribosyltransferase
MRDFVAFQAMIELLKETKKTNLLQEIYQKCKISESIPVEQVKNEVIALYDLFEYEQISKKISEIVSPKGIRAKVEVIFQTLEGLHQACPHNTGDWYFTGNYPTPGGNRVANRAFMNYVEDKDERAY